MERVWAPWRMAYVTHINSDDESCLFCTKVQSSDDKNNYVLERSEYSFSLLNIFPYNNGHMMVAPKRHVADLNDLSADELLDMMQLVQKMKKLLTEKIHPHGFNIGINCGSVGGAGIVDHLHIHIVPRWNGDTNFMPVIADVKVIPQSLDALYDCLMTS